jgi:ABC-type uncharacterized transport system substrate-binding protein
MRSITQIYILTQWKHKNTNNTFAIETPISTTLVYQYSQKQVVNAAVGSKQSTIVNNNNRFLFFTGKFKLVNSSG